MRTAKLDIAELVSGGNSLLARARATMFSATSENVRGFASRVPESLIVGDRRVEVVFAGQYSAGKSSIIKVLTGLEGIAVGADITTQEVHIYDLDGIRVVDTPGVHTKIRPDHDEKAYRAIADADLLVFVVTNELFDSHLAEHFRKLAIQRDKVHEMMLVVNKMRRCAKGNSSEAQAVIREDLRNVLDPFTPDMVRLTFIDAEAALESRAESDEVMSTSLWRKSGFDQFTRNLNSFTKEKGLAARYTTALYNLEQVLQEVLAAEPTEDRDIDGLEELLIRHRYALLEARKSIPRVVEAKIGGASSQIRKEGQRIADMINKSADHERVNQELRAAQDRVARQTESLDLAVKVAIEEQIRDLDGRVQTIINSELARELVPRLTHRIEDVGMSKETASNLKKLTGMSSKLGEFLVKNSFTSESGTLAGLFDLERYSGTTTHEAVTYIGKCFGKSFQPWEAVEWTRMVANVGRVLSVVGVILVVLIQIREDRDAEQLEKELRESRSAIRSGFNEAAHAVETHYSQAVDSYVSGTIVREIEAVDKQLKELRGIQKEKSELIRALTRHLEDAKKMIARFHAARIEASEDDGAHKGSPIGTAG